MATVRRLEIKIDSTGNAAKGLSNITGLVGGLGTAASLAATGGLVALGTGVAAVGAGAVSFATSGLSMNNTLEQASARIQAFTKDSKETAAILEMVKERAAATPFAFEEMMSATSSLMLSADAAGVSLESLIADAEILAASNPAQGVEGAAYALREAVGGDFTSLMERFDIPRSMIQKLKDEGVPNIDIVRQVMAQMGLDTDLVSQLANTAEGRWSTFKDTMTNFAATITKPIFDTFSSGLGGVNDLLVKFEPQITAVADVLAGSLADGIETMVNWIVSVATEAGPQMMEFLSDWKTDMEGPINETMTLVNGLIKEFAGLFGTSSDEISAADVIVGLFKVTLGAVTLAVELINSKLTTFKNIVSLIKTVWSTVGTLISNNVRSWTMAFNGVKSAITSVYNAFSTMARKAREAVDSVPDWLRPGSPTPFEIGLRGIAKAAKTVNGVLPSAFDINSNTPFGSTAVAGGGGVTVQLNYSPVISTADEFELERILTDVVKKINRK